MVILSSSLLRDSLEHSLSVDLLRAEEPVHAGNTFFFTIYAIFGDATGAGSRHDDIVAGAPVSGSGDGESVSGLERLHNEEISL